MTEERLARQIRLVLSWREVLTRQQEVNLRRGIDGAHRVNLGESDTRLLESVEARLDKLREQGRKEATQTAAKLRRALQARERLLARAGKGGAAGAKRLNQRNRELGSQIEAHRAKLKQLNALVSAQSSADAGGFIEMDEGDYAGALRSARGTLWQAIPSEDRRTIVLGILATLLGIAGVVAYMRWDEGVRFEAGYIEGNQRLVRVVCINNTPDPVVLHIPWQNDDGVKRGSHTYGVDLYLRDTAEDKFRLFPSAGDAWTYQGTPTHLEEPIQLPPRMRTEVRLDLDLLDLPAEDGGELYLSCTRGDGKELLRFQPVATGGDTQVQ